MNIDWLDQAQNRIIVDQTQTNTLNQIAQSNNNQEELVARNYFARGIQIVGPHFEQIVKELNLKNYWASLDYPLVANITNTPGSGYRNPHTSFTRMCTVSPDNAEDYTVEREAWQVLKFTALGRPSGYYADLVSCTINTVIDKHNKPHLILSLYRLYDLYPKILNGSGVFTFVDLPFESQRKVNTFFQNLRQIISDTIVKMKIQPYG